MNTLIRAYSLYSLKAYSLTFVFIHSFKFNEWKIFLTTIQKKKKTIKKCEKGLSLIVFNPLKRENTQMKEESNTINIKYRMSGIAILQFVRMLGIDFESNQRILERFSHVVMYITMKRKLSQKNYQKLCKQHTNTVNTQSSSN